MIEPDILTEVPETLKRLARLIARGFYSMEHAIIIDLLVRNPCMKEDDIAELLKFDRKQLRALLNTLKSDKFTKVRMKVETDGEGKSTRHNYFFINYQTFVNVVKYKLDHVRRKIEMEERDNTSRASFRCPDCQKTYTDLEVDQLFDIMSQTFVCAFCQSEVEEDESAVPKKDARTLLAKFNEQIQPVYELLKECDDIKLAPELMEPEPTDIRTLTNRGERQPNRQQQQNDGERTTWSGDATRNMKFGMADLESTVTISMDDDQSKVKQSIAKNQPVWMTESTIDGASNDAVDIKIDQKSNLPGPSKSDKPDPRMNEIETLLIIHEKKGAAPLPGPSVPAGGASDSDSSDSDMETHRKQSSNTHAVVEEMESDDEDETVPMVTIGKMKVSLHDVTDDMVAQMTPIEKENWIRQTQEMYQHMYE